MILSETKALFCFNPIQTETKPTITRCLHAKSCSISSANTFATTTTTIRYSKIGSHEASVATEFKGEHIKNLCTPLSHDSQSLSVKSLPDPWETTRNSQDLNCVWQCLDICFSFPAVQPFSCSDLAKSSGDCYDLFMIGCHKSLALCNLMETSWVPFWPDSDSVIMAIIW